ncbi:hypothetical protein CAPTEDRAFT_216503 [Capitella teleta]|uniref:BZIP domain-containing protein n=1 Tax=Capitella teleta TaxID=283909 RepID=R7TE19_CAPTE|nr:hypothetical protein CAPTEDRAFT_216503 [Capitella teleta]|eukprot:ELT91969.1 hypothetical protein CAPTEDRAFT_216503 [Capitella teleta]
MFHWENELIGSPTGPTSDGDDVSMDVIDDDLSQFLGLDPSLTLTAEELQLPDDFQMPLLDDPELAAVTAQMEDEDPWQQSDSSDSGISDIKTEPASPSSSSDCSYDAQSLLSAVPITSLTPGNDINQILIHNKPQVKEELPDSPPRTPPLTFTKVTQPTVLNGMNGYKIVLPASGQTLAGNSLIKSNVAQRLKVHTIKPVAPIQPKGNSEAATTQSKPIVLTQEEFSKLAAQGVLKLSSPAQKQVKPTQATPTYSQPANHSLASPTLSTSHHSSVETDYKIMKRQQRMIKNRESACLSRKRKKEYMSSLEIKLQEFSSENQKLRQENSTLKRKLDMVVSENSKLKTMKKGTSLLLAVSFLLILNLTPFLSMLSSQSSLPSPDAIHHGRTLLSFDEDAGSNGSSDHWFNSLDKLPAFEDTLNSLKETIRLHHDSSKPADDGQLSRDLRLVRQLGSMCPTYRNSSEAQRLLSELNGWALGHEGHLKDKAAWMKLFGGQNAENQKTKKKKKKVYHTPRKMKAAMREDIRNEQREIVNRQYEMQVFSGSQQNYNQFLNAIHHRNDTFYVVSFRSDHLLLPATAQNSTMKPRMSLVMPAVGLNDTMAPPSGSVAMMQIDCEVTATQLVHIEKAHIPGHVRNATEQQPRERSPRKSASNPHRLRDRD